jgi:hypothetical protein
MTDFRALCAELLKALSEWALGQGSNVDAPLIIRARAALEALPEPQGPTDEELDELYYSSGGVINAFARAVWSRAQTSRPAIEPVPVSERLPGPEDCDAEGRCWIGSSPTYEDDNFNSSWELSPFTHGDTHWLPHWVLPVPGVEGADA